MKIDGVEKPYFEGHNFLMRVIATIFHRGWREQAFSLHLHKLFTPSVNGAENSTSAILSSVLILHHLIDEYYSKSKIHCFYRKPESFFRFYKIQFSFPHPYQLIKVHHQIGYAIHP